LRTLLWRQGSYMRPKVSSYRHIEPFLRYLWFKGQPSGSTGKGQTVDPPVDHLDRFFLFFFNPCFCRIFLFSVISCSLLPSLDSLSRTLHTTPTHQTLETCPPYAYLPSCTASVLTLHCHPSQILLLTREMSLLLLCSRLFSHSLLGS
jgi:hypothetical protein